VSERTVSTLYQPPSHRRYFRKTANLWEKTGRNLPLVRAGGVLIAEVSKQVSAKPRRGISQKMRRPLRVLEGIAAPEPALRQGEPK
jgi:hypothetical protein